MFETIEELEKEIDQFQNNMAASGEMIKVLQQVLDQIQRQNTTFETESRALLAQLTALPDAVEKANASSNESICKNVDGELKTALDAFSKEQDRYISAIEQAKQRIQENIELSEKQVKQIGDFADRIQEENMQMKNELKKKITVLMVLSAISVVIGILGLFF